MRPDRVRQILGGGTGREHWPASSFPCHKTIVYGEDENGDEKTTIPPTAQQCAGVMWILHKEDRHNDAMQLGERFGFWKPERLDPTAPFYNSTDEAIRGQERDMVTTVKYGDIGSIRQRVYKCPHCGRTEPTRTEYRRHIDDAHPSKDKLTIGERSMLSNRHRKVPVTLSAPTRYKLTEPQVRALKAVRDGLVWQRFDRNGNVFVGPKEIGPILYRKLQSAGMIEDEPTPPPLGTINLRHRQRLTARGRTVLAAYGG